ncbi:ubiquitin-like-specific protease ESD4 [Oryza brachyantha]|uniref:ubiquitin-like-specific protease ESD4 n=1 Tax=Oryza brachyantha TaxID=4533 RepID=UPI000776259A|nr:ubiquitin-like-specific protease ESD4 [Oryza brachyantha]
MGIYLSRLLRKSSTEVCKAPPGDRAKQDLSELFTPLAHEEEREINNILCSSDQSKQIIVMHGPSSIEITKEIIRCLRPGCWLNDEVINLYLELLKERAERDSKKFLKCHFFNTFFYNKLACGEAGYDYQSVRRWTARLGYGLLECEKIFVPIHRGVHWCLAIINMKDKTFQYLDSLGCVDHGVLRILVDTSSWLEISDYIPLQQNRWDCGMFMLKFIDFHSRGVGLYFNQENMEYFRKRTAKEILRLRVD